MMQRAVGLGAGESGGAAAGQTHPTCSVGRGVSARTFRLALAAVVLAALILRLLVIADSPSFHPQTDAADYDRIALSLAQTGSFPSSVLAPRGGPTAFRPPAFPVALALTYKLTGATTPRARWQAGRVMEALLGSVTVLLLALLALELAGPAVALGAAGLAAIYPR